MDRWGTVTACRLFALMVFLVTSLAAFPSTPASRRFEDDTQQPRAGEHRECAVADVADDAIRESPSSPNENSAMGGELRIGAVFIDTLNVFDTTDEKQNRWLYRFANRLHMVSREESLRNQLLVHSGDPFSIERIEESERVLRARPGLYDAEIVVGEVHDGVADIEVHTRDVWTLSGGMRFGRSGGENRTTFSLRDNNFLGMGKQVRLKQFSSVDRTGTAISYEDPNLAGTRNRLSLSYGSNSDGESFSFQAGHPFFSLDSRWGFDLLAEQETRLDRRYLRGAPVDLFRHQRVRYELGGGLSRGLRDHRNHRFRFGVVYQEDTFAPGIGDHEDDPVSSGKLPADRLLVYPWVGYEFQRDSYVEETNLDLIDRTEDRYRGFRASARLGFSSSALGGDRSRWIFEGVLSDSWKLGNRQLVEVSISGIGRYGRDGFENTTADMNGRYYLRQGERWVLFARLGAEVARNLDFDRQLLLGGENGLRGFPLRYQDGNRRILFTLEERLFTDWKPFRLFNVGAAAFVDVGRAWLEGEDNGPYGGVLANVGLGLRLGNTRVHGSIVHIDVALPLGADPSIDSVQWLVSTRQSF